MERRTPRAIAAVLIILAAPAAPALGAGDLVVGRLTLVEASEAVPYAYWYYVPESVLDGRVAGLVWHATPGGTDPDDPVFWARFDLPQFLACRPGWAKPPIDLPEEHGLILFSIAVPRPAVAFYESCTGISVGFPDALSSLGNPGALDASYHDPDLRALASIGDLERRLSTAGIRFDARLFLTGVYRGAEWAHRFALLHPDRIRAVAPVAGNVYTIPVTALDDGPLPWPLGLAGFESLGRGSIDWPTYLGIPYYVTTSIHETLWYNRMTPEEQGIEGRHLLRYVECFGSIPPEREASFAEALLAVGLDVQLIWSEGGHGWTDPVRIRVFEFFASFERLSGP